jgi:hypothetical protein
MMYKDYINGFEMSDQNLSLYVVESFVFDLQKKGQEPRRSASTRFTRNPNLRYRGEDTAPANPAFTSYAGFHQARPSLVHHPRHDGWEQPAPYHSKASWQQGSSAQWEHGNFDYYQQQEYEISSDIQGRRMSFSAWGFHDQTPGFHDPYMGHHHQPPPMDQDPPVDLARIDTRLTTIEEGQQEIHNTLHQHAQW